jgi:superfamily I DNA/RNA helicase
MRKQDSQGQGLLPGFEAPAPKPPAIVALSPKLTPEQVAIAESVRSGTGHLLVEALAGSGKTFTIIESVKVAAAARILLCAFNKANRITLEAKLAELPKPPRGCDRRAKTANGLGFGILKSHDCLLDPNDVATDALVEDVVVMIETRITKDRVQAIADEIPIDKWVPWFPVGFVEGTDTAVISDKVKRAAIKLLTRLKETCVDRDVHEDDIEMLGQEIDAFAHINDIDVPLTRTIVRLAYLHGMRLDRAVIKRLGCAAIAYCDQVWLPLVLDLEPRKRFDLIFVDEAQDFSEPQFALVERMLAPDGRLVIVGDLCQSVYSWRGAVGDKVWAKMRAKGATPMPLTVSFRCSRAVVEAANEIVPKLRPCSDAPQGEVRKCSFTQMLKELPLTTAPCYVLSRNNAALFQTAIQLWHMRQHFHYHKSEEMASGLRGIIEKLDVHNAARFNKALEEWYSAERGKAEDRDAAGWADRLDQQYEMLRSMLQYAEPKHLGHVLDDLVAPKKSLVTLSTVHGAKGFEKDRVYLLQQTFARHQERSIHDLDRPIAQEELNLEYVAITRAQRELVWVDLSELKILKTQRRLTATPTRTNAP